MSLVALNKPNLVLSFRYEAQVDVLHFIQILNQNQVKYIINLDAEPAEPEYVAGLELEFPGIYSDDAAALRALADLMLQVPDGHVMVRTTKALPLAQNPLDGLSDGNPADWFA
jgi:hypothetical protein